MEEQPLEGQSIAIPDTKPYVLRKVLEDIPLQAEDGPENVSISCVEYWNENLYIGTSASELLHFVALPGETENEAPTYILASRLQPSGHAQTPLQNQAPGIQQILILPGVLKACVLCNGVVSFYTLPELSPASPSKEPTGIQWIGGIDENEDRDIPDGQVVMLANSRRIMLARVGEKPRHFKSIDFPGCLQSSRRDTIACVANDTSYALLEVEHQQQIPLFPISTSNVESEPSVSENPSLNGHSRSTSLGNPLSTIGNARETTANQHLEPPSLERRSGSPTKGDTAKPGSRPRSSTETSPVKTPRKIVKDKLRPHIVTPTPSEFMLTTGTSKTEPGVGLFVNLDGDVVRGTIEFERYPDAVLIYDFKVDTNMPSEDSDQHVFALLDKRDADQGELGIELQTLSATADTAASKTWLALSSQSTKFAGLHRCLTSYRYSFCQVTDLLRAVRFKPTMPRLSLESDQTTRASIKQLEQETALFDNQSPQAGSPTLEYEQKRNEEEKRYVGRFGQASTKAVAWCGGDLWQVLQNPLLLQLEGSLLESGVLNNGRYTFQSINVSRILSLLGSIRQRDPRNETEYLSMSYIRQKASLVLFLHLQSIMDDKAEFTSASQVVQNAMSESSIDPRVVLLLVPPVSREVLQGPNGIWLQQGMTDMLASFKPTFQDFQSASIPFWSMMRHFLSDWQEKRGYGSITDEKFVFDTVDAALLHILLYLDQALPEGSGLQKSSRAKLNNVVDHWKGDFQRAIFLLEHYSRLFVLSRLYQSRKLAKDVLSTWKRIAEGEHDADKSLTVETVEIQIRRYLAKIGNAGLVQEYGLWLAKRNPKLAVELFADDSTRVKLTPAEVVIMFKDQAPGAVQQYLEHLVFGKHLDQYADDLIGYYLDSVMSVLESSQNARESLEESYATYRALEAPKPTYLNFITQNAPPQPWWQSRLRLLQLLGSGGYATREAAGKELTYSVDVVLERLKPFSSYLVSESIILDARQGRHAEALRLLTHGLGDYDTAVRYCYFGGPAPSSSQPIDANLLPSREHQRDLFDHLFQEFLQIDDLEVRLDRTSHLLGTFASWFDPLTIFEKIPQDWTVENLSEFLVRSFRAAITQRNEALIMKALSAAQNLQNQAAYIEVCEKLGPRFESGSNESQPESMSVDAT